MLERISGLLYRRSSLPAGIVITLIYAWFIATVMPEQSAQSSAYAGEWGAPDRHVFYTPDELYAAVSAWGDAGRRDYIDFRLGADIVWAMAYTGFLAIWISYALRHAAPTGARLSRVNTFPLLTMAADYLENALGIILVGAYPERFDTVAWLAAMTTALKWLTLGISHLLLLTAIVLAIRYRLPR